MVSPLTLGSDKRVDSDTLRSKRAQLWLSFPPAPCGYMSRLAETR